MKRKVGRPPRYCMCRQTAFVLHHTDVLSPPQRERSPCEHCPFEILPVFIYVMHSRVLGITSSLVSFPARLEGI